MPRWNGLFLEEAPKVIQSYKWRLIPFSEKAASHLYITSKYGIRMAIKVEEDCSSPSGMTSPLTTLPPLA